jgi:hypothetical protein
LNVKALCVALSCRVGKETGVSKLTRFYVFAALILSKKQKQLINFRFRTTKLSNKQKQWITFKVSALEMRALEEYCQQTQRTKTDILRELIRNLPTYTSVRDDNPL